MKPYKDYDEYLIKSLKNPVEAVAYLNAAVPSRVPDPSFGVVNPTYLTPVVTG